MKLSSAIILGDSLKRANPRTWLSEDGSCGCALGGALLAVGETEANGYEETMAKLQKHWPWLMEPQIAVISHIYFGVANGTHTLDEIADYVLTIEPICNCKTFYHACFVCGAEATKKCACGREMCDRHSYGTKRNSQGEYCHDCAQVELYEAALASDEFYQHLGRLEMK